MAHQYADLDNLIKDLLPASVENEDEKEAIGRVLEGVSNFIDKFTRRKNGYFMPAAEDASTRRFRGENSHFLRLPPYVGIASIEGVHADLYYKNDETGWLYAFPANETNYSGVVPDFFYNRSFVQNYVYLVSARWGFAETPSAISESARQLTLRLWETQRGIFGQLTPSGIVIERAMPPWVETNLLEFRRREFEI